MTSKYKIVFITSFLLIMVSMGMSYYNYGVALESTRQQLEKRSLPLTVDNIYTEIQKHIIEPNLVASMMAHDTFLKDWLVHEEEDVEKISKYLETIKNKYHMFTTFLVSEKTQNYYTESGFIEKTTTKNEHNKWYFDFKKIQNQNEINLDYNDYIDDSMIMFINHKIFDEEFHFIGATGIGLKISYISDMLKKFRQTYHFNVYFLDSNAEIVLYEHSNNALQNLKNIPELYAMKDQLISKERKIIEYSYQGVKYLINTKYIPELNLYLVVEANTSDFTKTLENAFYFNLLFSFIMSLGITIVILILVRNYNKKLEHMAHHDMLTGLANRRTFNKNFEKFFLLAQRHGSDLSLLFFDIDDFKKVNDEHGHLIGDKVLERFSVIVSENIRQTDLLARWGGEEFIVAFMDSNSDNAQIIAEKIRTSLQEDPALFKLVKYEITASFGLTSIRKDDDVVEALHRVDTAMYQAKENGKNQIVVR